MRLALISVNVGMPAYLGMRADEPVLSAIRKYPVAAPTIELTEDNLAGDAQAERSVHGGRDKAVYAYLADHFPWWEENLSLRCAPAGFGENLTLLGATEEQIRIGDVFVWGGVELQVSQPRQPCFKFAMLHGRDDLGSAMIRSRFCGFYLRVLKPGTAPTRGDLVRTATDESAPSVAEIFAASYDKRAPRETLERYAACETLNASWRRNFAARARERA